MWLNGLVCVYTCQNATLLEITCLGSLDLFAIERMHRPNFRKINLPSSIMLRNTKQVYVQIKHDYTEIIFLMNLRFVNLMFVFVLSILRIN